jgi:glycine dehydrogenase subunit 2
MIQICKEAETTPEVLKSAPTSQIVGRLDEAQAVKQLDVAYRPWAKKKVAAGV